MTEQRTAKSRGSRCAQRPRWYASSKPIEPILVRNPWHETASQAAVELKKPLCRSFELQRQHVSRDDHHVASDERAEQFFQPLGRHSYIIIRRYDDLSCAFNDASVSSIRESSAGLVYQCDPVELGYYGGRQSRRGMIVDYDDFYWADTFLRCEAAQAFAQVFWPIEGRNDDGHRDIVGQPCRPEFWRFWVLHSVRFAI